MMKRSVIVLLLSLLLALWLERGVTVRAYQGSGVPDWAHGVESVRNEDRALG